MRRGNAGFSLIELLIGTAILSVLGTMIMLMMGITVRLYHSSAGTLAVHRDSYQVGQVLTRSVMEADSIYVNEEEEGIIFFTGRITPENESVLYEGELLWWNKSSRSLYRESRASLRVQKEEKRGELNGAVVKSHFPISAESGKEYLLSDKVAELKLEIFPELRQEDLTEKDDYFYITDSAVTVNFAITYIYLGSGEYESNVSSSTRNRIKYLWISGLDQMDRETQETE